MENLCEESVVIDRPVSKVAEFVSHPINLPKWTKFFLKIDKESENRYRAETVMGLAYTQIIIICKNNYEIVSQFKNKTEKAKMNLMEIGDSTQFTFTFSGEDFS